MQNSGFPQVTVTMCGRPKQNYVDLPFKESLLQTECYLFLLFLLLLLVFQNYAYPLFTLINTNNSSLTEVTYARKYRQETCILLPFNKKIISVPPRVYIFMSFCKGSFFHYEASAINEFLENLPVLEVHSKISGTLQMLSNGSCELILNK